MQCLIDGDILLYEIGFSGQFKDEETGEIIPRDFDTVAELLNQKIKEIEGECWATEPSIVYITGKTNFRNDVAKKKPYKGNRKDAKPFHYGNLKAYIKANYDTRWEEGLEADDLMAIEQTSRLRDEDTIICTRDKDLRMVEGMHFGWPCGAQPQYGPKRVSKLGGLGLNDKKKLTGEGLSFFYSQLITGDTVDNIMGLPKGGPVLAYSTLDGLLSEQEMYEAVLSCYVNKYGDDALEELMEQAQLLWMVNELDGEGKPIMWRPPYELT